ncbi:MAG: HAD family hydrolase [Sedimentisphaerales bacterium]|nr:HAD family hydrolase [Sedimentisphaerales bacterium]
MKEIRFKAVLFDLDGTLLDTLEDLANSMNVILNAHGMNTFPIDDYKEFLGLGLEALIRCVIPEDKVNDKIVDEFLACMRVEYGKRWAEKTKPYPEIHELLDELQAMDLKLVVLSNKADDYTQIIVSKLLPNWQFDIVRGLKDDFPPKPDPASALQIAHELKIEPADFLYLGDTDIDMQTANAAGMYAVGVLWGFRTADELNENGAKTLLESPLQVLDLLNN